MKTKDVIGIALDLNLEPVNGVRIDELIKRSLRRFYNELKHDFVFYLHNPKSDLHDLESNEINESYFSSELNDFSLPCPFEWRSVLDTLLARVTNDYDIPVLIIITNRYFEGQKSFYELMLRNNLKRDLNCNVILVGVGDNYDKDSFSSLEAHPFCDFAHLDLNELEELDNVLLFTLKGGEDQIVLSMLTKQIESESTSVGQPLGRLNEHPKTHAAAVHISGQSRHSLDKNDGFKLGKFEVHPSEIYNGSSLKGCAEARVCKDVVAKKSVKSIKKPTKKAASKPTKKAASKPTKKAASKKSKEDK